MQNYQKEDIDMPTFSSHICLKGHASSHPLSETPEAFCALCSAPIITKCPSCQKEIIFSSESWDAILGRPPIYRPLYCSGCGNPYPWTEASIEGAEELIKEDNALSYSDWQKLIQSLPDIVSETPKTKVAVLRFQKALLSVGQFTAEGLRQFALDFGCDFSKSLLGQ